MIWSKEALFLQELEKTEGLSWKWDIFLFSIKFKLYIKNYAEIEAVDFSNSVIPR